MLLAGPNAMLRGKLTEKVKYRPTAAIEPLLPAGTDALEDLPEVRPGVAAYDLVRSEPTSEELAAYGAKIKRTAAVFARSQVKQGMLAEHDTYTVWVATYLQLSGFGNMSSSTMRCVLIGRMGRVASRASQRALVSAHVCVAPLASCIVVRDRRRSPGSAGL